MKIYVEVSLMVIPRDSILAVQRDSQMMLWPREFMIPV